MKCHSRIGAIVFAAMLGVGAHAAKNGSSGPEVVVKISKGSMTKGGAAYGQNPLIIQKGSNVKWINEDTVVHTVTSDDGELNSGDIEPGKQFTHVFKKSGKFPYYCTLHGKTIMFGEVDVK